MRACSTGSTTEVPNEGKGASCAVVVSQPNGDPGGWKILVFADFGEPVNGTALVGTVQLSAAAVAGANVRVAAMAAMGGAKSWRAIVKPPAVAPPKRIQVGLVVSDITGVGFTNVLP